MLVEVYWELVGKQCVFRAHQTPPPPGQLTNSSCLVKRSGFNKDITDVASSGGNIVFLHLLVDALPLQPCNPTFLQARDGTSHLQAVSLYTLKDTNYVCLSASSHHQSRRQPIQRGQHLPHLESK